MKYPVLTEIKRKSSGVTKFWGYDHRLKPAENAFFDMQNMSSEWLPVMGTRRKRGYLRTLERPNGLFAHDGLCWVDGKAFFYNGVYKGEVEDSPKQMIRMGAYVLIWPDAKYYNTHTDEFGQLGAAFTTYSDMQVECSLCTIDGSPFENYSASAKAPENPVNGQQWLDTSVTPNVLRIYSETAGMWQSVQTVYTKIASPDIGKAFKQHDGIEISGMENAALNGTFYVVNSAEDYIVVVALISEPITQSARVTVERKIPQMDFVAEHENRVWGCSSERHEIYCCALGDASNWYQFMGLASDSYAVTVGTSGEFTGAKAHQGNMLFFKENSVHTVMGTKPANFQVETSEAKGVMRGCHKSLVAVNGMLMYKNRFDVCRFGASMPVSISEALGGVNYQNAVGGAVNSRYYICMQDEQGQPHLFVYDTANGAWAKEDHADVMDFATIEGSLYMLLTNGELWCVNGQGAEVYRDGRAHLEGAEEPNRAPEWMLETGDIGIDEPNSRYVSGIQIHGECELGATVYMDIKCDASPVWEQVMTCTPVTRRSLTIPYVPRRCRTLKIRLRGNGEFKLFGIVKNTEAGSDVYGTA